MIEENKEAPQVLQAIQNSPINEKPKFSPKRVLIGILLGILLTIVLVFGKAIIISYQRKQFEKNQGMGVVPSLITPTTISQEVDEIANWKTYKNSQYGFEFKYPQSWKISSEKLPDNVVIGIESDIDSGLLYGPVNPSSILYRIDVGIINNVSNLKEWLLKNNSGVNIEITKIENNNLNYFKTSDVPSMSGELNYYIPFKQEGSYLILSLSPYSKQNEYKKEKEVVELFDQILSTVKFTEVSSNTPTSTVQVNGAKLTEIKYTLIQGWDAKLSADNLMITPNSGGGYLLIRVVNYSGNIGRREYYCQVRKVCIKETYFTETKIGNISGYKAEALDNSGGGSEYFGSKGNKFYIISTYSPPSPNEFEKNYQNILNSLIF